MPSYLSTVSRTRTIARAKARYVARARARGVDMAKARVELELDTWQSKNKSRG